MSTDRKRDAARAQAALFGHWRRTLSVGAVHLGWKIGINDPRARRFYGLEESVVGFLTEDSIIEERRDFEAETLLMVEPELAIGMIRDVDPEADEADLHEAIGEVRPALEILNFDQPRRTLDEVMAHNIFHLGVAFGPPSTYESAASCFVECRKNGEGIASARAPQALPPLERIVGLVARTLCRHGEQLNKGEVIISGAMTAPIPLETDQALEVSFSGLGLLRLKRESGGGIRFDASRQGARWMGNPAR